MDAVQWFSGEEATWHALSMAHHRHEAPSASF